MQIPQTSELSCDSRRQERLQSPSGQPGSPLAMPAHFGEGGGTRAEAGREPGILHFVSSDKGKSLRRFSF